MHFGTFQLTTEGIDEPLRALDEARRARTSRRSRFRTLGFGESVRLPCGERQTADQSDGSPVNGRDDGNRSGTLSPPISLLHAINYTRLYFSLSDGDRFSGVSERFDVRVFLDLPTAGRSLPVILAALQIRTILDFFIFRASRLHFCSPSSVRFSNGRSLSYAPDSVGGIDVVAALRAGASRKRSGTITGEVKDSTGAVVPGATVTVVEQGDQRHPDDVRAMPSACSTFRRCRRGPTP